MIQLLNQFICNHYLFINKTDKQNPCAQCGANTQCINEVCTCLPEYKGDPYLGCRPECVLNFDCSRDEACINNKCKNPCIGTCGRDALCKVANHIPICTCPLGMSGNPFVICSPVEGMINTFLYISFLYVMIYIVYMTFLRLYSTCTKRSMQSFTLWTK